MQPVLYHDDEPLLVEKFTKQVENMECRLR